MTIFFFDPLSKAWNRMKAALFKPFDLHKWFVIGFNAFLAGLLDGHHGSGGSRSGGRTSFREFVSLPERGWEWLMDNPGWAIAIAFLALVAIVIAIVLLWLSSRGIFMFMDNVVHDKAEVAKPWREYRKEGNSLFVWRLIFSLIGFAAFVALAAYFFITASSLYDRSFGRVIPIGFTIGMALLAFLLVIVISYISLFLKDFIAPIMYKNRISAVEAWRSFLKLFGKYPFQFIVYGIIIFLMIIGFVVFVIIAGIVTCCIGWLVLIIPYIGTVATLPIWYTFRAFSLEFLAQFGPDFNLFPPGEAESRAEAQVAP